MRVINATKFYDYIICPSLYDYKYLHNFKEVLYENTKKTKLGTLIHNIIDADFKNIPILPEHIKDEKINQWFNFYKNNYLPDSNLETHNEYEFNIPIKTNLESVILTGRLDRVIFENNKAVIIDWKSTEKKTKLSRIITDLQMDFYAYALSKLRNIESIEIKIVYLDLKQEVIRNLTFQEIEKIEEKIINMINKTNPSIKSYIPNPIIIDKDIPFCNICDLNTICESFV
ncbi:MAG: PD-(D/E)XK nuclease family protein [Candidatus Sericytochromatia bacterium]|nr:PD-(D/E)XK nuclease family protein [Candidatus Sericytochromatia bacterium]